MRGGGRARVRRGARDRRARRQARDAGRCTLQREVVARSRRVPPVRQSGAGCGDVNCIGAGRKRSVGRDVLLSYMCRVCVR